MKTFKITKKIKKKQKKTKKKKKKTKKFFLNSSNKIDFFFEILSLQIEI